MAQPLSTRNTNITSSNSAIRFSDSSFEETEKSSISPSSSTSITSPEALTSPLQLPLSRQQQRTPDSLDVLRQSAFGVSFDNYVISERTPSKRNSGKKSAEADKHNSGDKKLFFKKSYIGKEDDQLEVEPQVIERNKKKKASPRQSLPSPRRTMGTPSTGALPESSAMPEIPPVPVNSNTTSSLAKSDQAEAEIRKPKRALSVGTNSKFRVKREASMNSMKRATRRDSKTNINNDPIAKNDTSESFIETSDENNDPEHENNINSKRNSRKKPIESDEANTTNNTHNNGTSGNTDTNDSNKSSNSFHKRNRSASASVVDNNNTKDKDYNKKRKSDKYKETVPPEPTETTTTVKHRSLRNKSRISATNDRSSKSSEIFSSNINTLTNNVESTSDPILMGIIHNFQQQLMNHMAKITQENDEKIQKMSLEKAKMKLELQTKEWTTEILQAENERLHQIIEEKEKETESLKKHNLKLLSQLSKKS